MCLFNDEKKIEELCLILIDEKYIFCYKRRRNLIYCCDKEN